MAGMNSAELLTPLDSVVYKSVRTHEDRLDSSPLELQFRLGAPFLSKVLSLYQQLYDEQVGHHDADHALQTAFKELVSCEILYYNNEVPMVYVEHDPNSESKDGVLTPITPPDLRFFLDESTKRLTVAVERRFPLSSAHGGRPFRLAFVFGDSIVATRKFCVMAKKGKAGTERKRMRPQKICAMSARRTRELDLIKTVTGSATKDCFHASVKVSTTTAPPVSEIPTRRKRMRRDSGSTSGSSVQSFVDEREAAPVAIAQPWTPPTLSPDALRVGTAAHSVASSTSVGSSVGTSVSSPISSSSTNSYCTPTDLAMPCVFPPVPRAPFSSSAFPDSPAPGVSTHSFTAPHDTSKNTFKDVDCMGGGGGVSGEGMTWESIMGGEPLSSPEELRELLDFGDDSAASGAVAMDVFDVPSHDDFVVLPLGLEESSKDLF